MEENSLYDRIGGKPAVRATVALLYQKILDDDSIAHFFDDIDIDALRKSQTAFVTMAFGGPAQYSGNSLRKAHKNSVKKGLSDTHFNAVATHLRNAMLELSVPQNLIEEAMLIVESTRGDVLNH